MPIPDFQTIMLPLLKLAATRDGWNTDDARDALGEQFGLTDEELSSLLPSGRQRTFANRVGWAVSYLAQAVLLERTGRAQWRITERGRAVLTSPPPRITINLLADLSPEFREFRSRSRPKHDAGRGFSADEEAETPEERLQSAEKTLRQTLEIELLDRVKQVSPAFFEQLVLDLLIAMGYGGSVSEAAERLGRSGDEGVDGVINEDKLGPDVLYVQAKRYTDQPVRRPDVQAFAGSLEGQRARKGVFITTSYFTADARDFVNRIEKRIVLLDGQELARLMIDHGVGVSKVRSYNLLRLDETYFEEAET